jgi:hypothetical protein
MDQPAVTRAVSFEQDLLRCVLDQDSVPQILDMARDMWSMTAPAAWAALQQQAALGRLRAYRGAGQAADLVRASLSETARDHALFVGPTDLTFARLDELSRHSPETAHASASAAAFGRGRR